MLFIITRNQYNEHFCRENADNSIHTQWPKDIKVSATYNTLEMLCINASKLNPTEHVIAVPKSADQLKIISQLRKKLESGFTIVAINENKNTFDRGLLIASGANDVLPFAGITGQIGQISTL